MPNPQSVGSGIQSLDTNPVYQSLRLQMSDAEVELVELQSRYAQSQREVARLRADVDKIAQVETDLKRLNRDYGVVEGRHQELLKRWETLQSKKRLDPVTDQVQFNILEPPFASAKPVAPNPSQQILRSRWIRKRCITKGKGSFTVRTTLKLCRCCSSI